MKIIIVKLKLMSGILLDPEFYEDIISYLKLIGDHFMDEVKRNGDHLSVGIISGASQYSLPQHMLAVCFNLEL